MTNNDERLIIFDDLWVCKIYSVVFSIFEHKQNDSPLIYRQEINF